MALDQPLPVVFISRPAGDQSGSCSGQDQARDASLLRQRGRQHGGLLNGLDHSGWAVETQVLGQTHALQALYPLPLFPPIRSHLILSAETWSESRAHAQCLDAKPTGDHSIS